MNANKPAPAFNLGQLHLVREAPEDEQVQQPNERVGEQERPIGSSTGEAKTGKDPYAASTERASRTREVAQHIVEGKEPGSLGVSSSLGQHRLLDGQEGANFRTGCADRAGKAAK